MSAVNGHLDASGEAPIVSRLLGIPFQSQGKTSEQTRAHDLRNRKTAFA
jgi:hypothetical protein